MIVKKISDIKEVVDSLVKKGKKFVLRGQTVDKPLLPKIARDNYFLAEVEAKIFEEFKKDASQYINNREEISSLNDDFEKLVLGEHYKLKTRCLNWTVSTDVALFFAVAEDMDNNDKNGVVWIYDLMPYKSSEWLLPGDRSGRSPFQFQEIKIFHPKSFLDFRTDMQGALVIIHPHPWRPMEELSDNKRLIKMLVPAYSKQSIRDELNKRHNINKDSLFSKENKAKELECICMAINNRYVAKGKN